jgi:hypothetical protein
MSPFFNEVSSNGFAVQVIKLADLYIPSCCLETRVYKSRHADTGVYWSGLLFYTVVRYTTAAPSVALPTRQIAF